MEISKTEIIAYSKTEQALSELRTKYETVVFDVTSTKGMGAAKEARAELRTYRVDLEKVRVLEKAESLAYGRLVDSEAKRITAELGKLEGPIDSMIKAEEKRKADEKAERERIEKERIEAIRARIGNIERWPLRCIGMNASSLGEQVAALSAEKITDELFNNARCFSSSFPALMNAQLREMFSAKIDEEAKAEEQRLEAIRLEELRKADDERIRKEREEEAARVESERAAQKERDRIETDRVKAELADQREKLAKEMERQKLEDDRVRAELKAQQDKIDQERIQEEQRIAAERQKLAEARAIEEDALATVRAQREAEEARIKSLQDASELIESKSMDIVTDEDAENIIDIERPSDRQILNALSNHYAVHELTVIQWLFAMDLSKAEDEIYKEENFGSII